MPTQHTKKIIDDYNRMLMMNKRNSLYSFEFNMVDPCFDMKYDESCVYIYFYLSIESIYIYIVSNRFQSSSVLFIDRLSARFVKYEQQR
jgi:hypothetical protein